MNNKGVSVISLVVTIIIIILIASITIYNGVPMIENSTKVMAEQRLQAIAQAILAHEKELNYTDIVGDVADPRLVSRIDYEIMGLPDYAVPEEVPPTYVYKEALGDVRKYHLTTYKIVKRNYKASDVVSYEFEYQDKYIRNNFKIEFDEAKNVNRPLISEKMEPIRVTFDNEYYKVENVDDIYAEDWYDYNSTSPVWANVMIKSSLNNKYLYYVWIPRFAYKVSTFDSNTDFRDIPASSIQIEFLKGTSDYMKNGEVLPTGFQVHPAFKYKENGEEVNIPGFWVAKETVSGGATVLYGDSSYGAAELSMIDNIHPDENPSDVSSHLIKNSEWAAVAYLSHATVGNVADGSSLGEWNASGVFSLNSVQFVAGGISSKMPAALSYGDKYTVINPDNITYESYEKDTLKYGDAMIVTSSRKSDKSAWFGGTSIMISDSAPFIMRGYDNNLFSYNATVRDPEGGGAFRNVLLVNGK